MSTLALGPSANLTNFLGVELRAFEMLLQNNLETDTKRAERYGRFISLLKEVDGILQTVPPNPPPGPLADLLALTGKEDWGNAMKYDHVRNVHVVDIKKPDGETPFDFAPESIERRLHDGYEQMRKYL